MGAKTSYFSAKPRRHASKEFRRERETVRP
jgi:hypothetical protein